MTALGTFKSQIYVMVEGIPLSPFIAGQLVSADVESSMFLPDQFRLVFRGSRSDVLEQGRFQIASEVEISMLAGEERLPLVTGEVTALEVDFGRDGNLTVITGLDRCHRMMMGTKGMSWVGMTASDIVLEIIDDYGMIPGEIEPTTTVYPVLEQPNISDWAFVQQLAFLENRDAYISQGFFTFKAPALASEGDTIPAMNYETPVLASQLVLGKNLLHLHAVVTGSEQVPTVTVMGWDPTLAVPVTGVNVVTPVSSAPDDPGAEPEIVSGELGSKEFIFSDWPCDSEGQAETRAQSIAAQLAGGFAEMEGECQGDPNVVAGAVVSLGMAGQPFDGKYVVTSARHRFTPGAGGYTTWFNVGGRRDRGLASLGGASDPRLERQAIPGVAIGVVEQVDDPEEMCRVKVRYPWLGEMIVSDWVRTVQPGSGPGYGFVVIPEPETEVLLAFDHGDINHPYIIGNLYNGMARPIPPPTMDPAGGIGERRIESRLHHMLQFNDGPEEQGINLVTGEDECAITLSVEGSGGTNTITINSLGEVVIKAEGAVQIQSVGDMSLTSTGMLSLSADGEVSISSQAALTMKANAEMALQCSAVLTVSGSEIMLGG